jgi:hypothetical protein
MIAPFALQPVAAKIQSQDYRVAMVIYFITFKNKKLCLPHQKLATQKMWPIFNN